MGVGAVKLNSASALAISLVAIAISCVVIHRNRQTRLKLEAIERFCAANPSRCRLVQP